MVEERKNISNEPELEIHINCRNHTVPKEYGGIISRQMVLATVRSHHNLSEDRLGLLDDATVNWCRDPDSPWHELSDSYTVALKGGEIFQVLIPTN